MGSCFLTHHGTVLCFSTDDTSFRHLPIEAVDEASAVIAEADPVSLRAGLLTERPVAIRPSREARLGLPRAVAIGPGRERPLVTLAWREHFLCAGGGEAILQSDHVDAWEEFLPLDEEDLVLLRDLARGGWQRTRDGRALEAGAVWTQSGYALHLGALLVDLRQQPPLGGRASLRDGLVTVLDGGWRIETFRRFDPVVVWRHDGTEEADDEIVLGLRSLLGPGGYRGRVRVASRFGREALLERVAGLGEVELGVTAPEADGRGMVPSFAGEGSRGPFLFLANGVLCAAPVMPLMRGLAGEREVACLPWRWDEGSEIAGESGMFARDPAEGAEMLPPSGAVLGVPNEAVLSRTVAAMRTIASNAPDRLARGDAGFDDLLRYVGSRTGGIGTRFLARHAAAVRSDGGRAGEKVLWSFRPLPAAIRAAAMREFLVEAGVELGDAA